MNVVQRPGDCVVKQLDDGRLSVLRADPVIHVSVDLLKSARPEHFAWNGHLMAIDAIEGVVIYEFVERVTDWGQDYIRMEKVA
jgi:hypothetical protein